MLMFSLLNSCFQPLKIIYISIGFCHDYSKENEIRLSLGNDAES